MVEKTQDERIGTLEGLIAGLTNAVERLTDKVDVMGKPQWTGLIALVALVLSFGSLVYATVSANISRVETKVEKVEDFADAIVPTRYSKDDAKYDRAQEFERDSVERELLNEIRRLEADALKSEIDNLKTDMKNIRDEQTRVTNLLLIEKTSL